jgi:hypothetical protein
MRSELVFGALAHMSNRYQLCQLVSKGARKLHRPKHRVQDTTNDVTSFSEEHRRVETRPFATTFCPLGQR